MSPPLSRPETGPAARWRPGDPDPLAEGLLGSFLARSVCGWQARTISLAAGGNSCVNALDTAISVLSCERIRTHHANAHAERQ
jgi:hypothetical protein